MQHEIVELSADEQEQVTGGNAPPPASDSKDKEQRGGTLTASGG